MLDGMDWRLWVGRLRKNELGGGAFGVTDCAASPCGWFVPGRPFSNTGRRVTRLANQPPVAAVDGGVGGVPPEVLNGARASTMTPLTRMPIFPRAPHSGERRPTCESSSVGGSAPMGRRWPLGLCPPDAHHGTRQLEHPLPLDRLSAAAATAAASAPARRRGERAAERPSRASPSPATLAAAPCVVGDPAGRAYPHDRRVEAV